MSPFSEQDVDSSAVIEFRDSGASVSSQDTTPVDNGYDVVTHKRNFHPYHSKSVPKSANLGAAADERNLVTTMMLRNIPNKYTQSALMQEIDDMGLGGTYDFFYLPMDVHNRSNVGYAFINFVDPASAERFHGIFKDHRFRKHQSRKISFVCPAHVQGLDANLRHFENRAVTHAKNNQYRPVVLRGKERVEFEDAIAEAKARADAAPKAQPTADCRGNATAQSARQELEEALCEFLRQRSDSTACSSGYIESPPGISPISGPEPPPATDHQMAAPTPFFVPQQAPEAANDDVGQLLSLKSMLENRLQERCFPAVWPQLGSIAGPPFLAPLDGPAYIPLPSMPSPQKLFKDCEVESLWTSQEFSNCVTPRSIAVTPGSVFYKHMSDGF